MQRVAKPKQSQRLKGLNRKLNWKPSPLDERDFVSKRHLQAPSVLPGEFVSPIKVPVYDQGNTGSCTGNGGVLCFRNEFIELTKNYDLDFSRLFLYYNTREIEGTVDEDSGAYIRDVFKALNKKGLCEEKYFPYIESTFRNKPTEEAYKNALNYLTVRYASVPKNVLQIKQTIYSGALVEFGFLVYSSFLGSWEKTTGDMPIPKKGERIEGGHAVCCLPETKIITEKGITTIDRVSESDRVLTREGFKQVLNTSIREVDENIFSINYNTGIKPLLITKEHPVLVKKSSRKTKKELLNFDKLEFVPASDLKEGYWVCSKIDDTIEDNLDISEDFARLLGYYIGDGNLQIEYYKDSVKSIKFRLSYHRECKKGIVEDLIQIVEKEFPGTKHSIWESKISLANNIIFYNTELGKKILKYCGKAKNKTAQSILNLPSTKQLEFLQGWFKTDGNGVWMDTSMISTSDENLADDLIHIIKKNRLIYSTYIKPFGFSIIRGKNCPTKEAFRITFHTKMKNSNMWYDKNILFSRIKSIEMLPYRGNVYNLQVQDLEEYTANNIIVHNCAVGWSDAKQAFYIQNSWGTEWGKDGYFWMPYSFAVSSNADDFWCIEEIKVNNLPEPIPIPEPEPEPILTELSFKEGLKRVLSKQDLIKLNEGLVVKIGKELGLETDVNLKKSDNVDLVWDNLAS